MWTHWAFRASTPFQPFSDFETARKTWASLAKTFPEIVAAVLMPNHGHLILPKSGPGGEMGISRKLYGILGPISKERRIKDFWQAIPSPAIIPDKFHLKRQVRYVALNPCRRGLCRDPLEWYWSTYREIFGAAARGNGNAQKLAHVLGDRSSKFLDRIHAYVSGDPSVAVTGTPRPTVDTPQIYSYKSIDEILAAASAALRVLPSSVKNPGELRVLFIHLANHQGWQLRTSLLAEICDISPRAVRYILQKPIHNVSLQAAHLCLSDIRLRPVRVTESFLPGGRDHPKYPST